MTTETKHHTNSYRYRSIPNLLAEDLRENGITDVGMADLINQSAARLRELMFAIGSLPQTGCEIDEDTLDPLMDIADDEARKISATLEVWQEQKQADAIAIRERISAIMTALYTLEEAISDKTQEIDRDALLQAVGVCLWVLSSENEKVLPRFLGYQDADLELDGNTLQAYLDARRKRIAA